MTFPSFITSIASALFIVESLCATMKLVLPAVNVSKARWIFISVLVSIDEVASSRISIGGRQSITLAMHKSCFCPAESPSSPIIAS